MSECADFDNNGKCDVCGADFGTNVGAIVAVISGVVASLGAIGAACWYFLKKPGAPTPTAPEAAPETNLEDGASKDDIAEDATSEAEDSAEQESEGSSEE